MKNHIIINGLPTYDDDTNIDLKRVNLFFGKNGSGKSTLCNYIKMNPNLVTDNQEELIVFNKDYKKTYIIDGMKGIYTFGKADSDIINDINIKKQIIDEKNSIKNKELENARNTNEQKEKKRTEFEEEVWNRKKEMINKYPAVELFKGYNKSKEKFTDQLISIFEKYSEKEYDESKINYYYNLSSNNDEELFVVHPELELINCSKIKGYQLLSKSVVSYSDNDLNKYYSKLNNIRWIREGRIYITKENQCPFCQSILSDHFCKDFKAIFDEVYEEEINELSLFISQYSEYYEKINNEIDSILSNKCDKVDYKTLEKYAMTIKLSIKDNKKQLDEKKNDSSIVVKINDITDDIVNFNQCIRGINKEIEQYNDDLRKRKEIPEKITELLWIKLSKELRGRCISYKKCNQSLSNQYNGHVNTISTIDKEIKEIEVDIQEKNSLISNIESTVLEINNLLSNFGFKTFKLEINDDNPGTYRIIRSKGVESVETLSEGEFNLIAFLYLYRLIYGSLDINKSNNSTILVIDDPVSSMDGDTMGIISTLTKKIIKDCIERKSRVEQLLIFTHNVFYYKEIEYRSKNNKISIYYHNIIKNGEKSIIETSDKSKIHSNYEQLWIEYNHSISSISSFNCMRRIMEYYFRSLIGADNYDGVRSQFDESEIIVFDGLTNMLNSGSHSIFDPIDTYIDDSTIERYKIIFKKVFEITGNIAHYNYMTNLVA